MTDQLADYVQSVIDQGDEGSDILGAKTAHTWLFENSEHGRLVDVIENPSGSLRVLRLPEGYKAVVHSIGGDPAINDLTAYAESVVERLVAQSASFGAVPVAFTTDINSQKGDIDLLEQIIAGLNRGSESHNVPNINGENAILGDCVAVPANIIGTMVSMTKLDLPASPDYASFDPEGKAIHVNNDGPGTKPRLYERLRELGVEDALCRALLDVLAMKLDDLIKLGATVKAVSDIVETSGDIPFNAMRQMAHSLGESMGFTYILGQEDVGDRIRGFREGVPSYNMGGGSVSVIDENRLQNPLHPSTGEYLIAIVGADNGRANGFTGRRGIMVASHGPEWHKKTELRNYLDFLGAPSDVFYSVFKELIDQGLATSVYHMSGGAFDGKLARPLAQNGLFVELHDLFEPCAEEKGLVEMAGASMRDAYKTFCMGNPGFITTKDPAKSIRVIESQGFKAREVGQLRKAEVRSGVQMTAYDGTGIYFSARKE